VHENKLASVFAEVAGPTSRLCWSPASAVSAAAAVDTLLNNLHPVMGQTPL